MKKLLKGKKYIKSAFAGSMLSNQSGQDASEYGAIVLVAVLIAGIVWAAFREGPFREKIAMIFANWVSP